MKAIRESGVRYVLVLSSVGADLPDGTGLIAGLHSQEERLKELIGTNILFLRPVSFFENFYQSLRLIKEQGIIVDGVAADLAVPMIARPWSRVNNSTLCASSAFIDVRYAFEAYRTFVSTS